MRGDTPAKLVIDVLKEARAHFGPFTDDNKTQIARWVKQRTEQLLRNPTAPAFDAKALSARSEE